MKTEVSLKKFKYKVAAFYNFISIVDQDILLIKKEEEYMIMRVIF